MARARNIKPGFFTNDDLVELPFEARLLFIGLWTIADRAGRLLDRPKKIKMDIFPGDNVDCEAMLEMLKDKGFVRRYEAEGIKAIQVVNWAKHQNPHIKEAPSTIPEPHERVSDLVQTLVEFDASMEQELFEHGASTIQAQCSHDDETIRASENPERAGLIPDSGFLIPDSPSLIPDTLPFATADAAATKKPNRRKARAEDAPDPRNLETWRAYKHAYAVRYGAAPIQNQIANALIKQLVKHLGDEAPHVAEFYVLHNGRNYVANLHGLKLLINDHAKLRTEWATKTVMTSAQATQIDRTQTNHSAFAGMIAEARARESMEDQDAK